MVLTVVTGGASTVLGLMSLAFLDYCPAATCSADGAVTAVLMALAVAAVIGIAGVIITIVRLGARKPGWPFAVGTLLALAAALVAACFVRAFGILYLGRPRGPEAAAAQETDRFSRAAMLGLCALCVLAGVLPGVAIDALAPAVHSLAGAELVQGGGVQGGGAQLGGAQLGGVGWLSVRPIADRTASYSGLMIALFLAVAGLGSAALIHRLAGRRTRRARLWDCGYPGLGPASQYTASSLSQPLRRVLGSVVFAARDALDMPPPGTLRPARIAKTIHDPAWEGLFAPIGSALAYAAGKLNHLQFLTIRRYLGGVFVLLVGLLLLVGITR